MKKVTSKVLTMLLAMTLIFTSAGVAFAGTESVATKQEKASVEATAVNDVQAAMMKKVAAGKRTAKATYGGFTLSTLKTGSDSEFDRINSDEFGFDGDAVLNANYKGMSTAVKIPAKGTVTMALAGIAYDATGTNQVSGYSMTYGLFYDAACTSPVDSTRSVISNGSVSSNVFTVPKSGTYYIGVYTTISNYSTAKIYAGEMASVFANGADRTLSNKTWSVVGLENSQTNYFKFKAAYNGYVTVTTDNLYGKVTLLSSSKKTTYSNAISAYSSSDANITYGVRKGTTYTLKVTSNSNYDGMYRLKYSNKSVTEKSGTSRSKAVTVSRNSTKKGYIAAGSSQADWYKIKLTKSTMKITLSGATCDKIVAKLYNSKGKAVSSSTASISRSGYNYYLSGKNLKKGTYYIKVYRANSKSSGYYNLKWN